MERQSGVEYGETEKYQPKYIIFLGRHAEPAKGSIFDQIGGETGVKCDNFEESSLTLKGIVEASLFGPDLLPTIFARMPQGKVHIILGNSPAYRTRETAEIVKENLEIQAKRLGREVEVEFEGPEINSNLIEEKDEQADKSVADVSAIISGVKNLSTEGHTVFLGVTHEQKLRNYLVSTGVNVDKVGTAEFLSITDLGQDRNKISFCGQSVEK